MAQWLGRWVALDPSGVDFGSVLGSKVVPRCSQNDPETDWKAFGRQLRHRKNAKDDFRLLLDGSSKPDWSKIIPKIVKNGVSNRSIIVLRINCECEDGF